MTWTHCSLARSILGMLPQETEDKVAANDDQSFENWNEPSHVVPVTLASGAGTISLQETDPWTEATKPQRLSYTNEPSRA